ncbi:uncharacterized protein EV154DRAFT_245239 [Mucor mucedo]|uniref:uncharacterized protein n=1 Tax=Mucor mucedo TaxID=29922 RepID=UPI00221E71DB|nr:uncharacterized protein EV154DRAFT_245239 [Mucor mucedo]KAI7890693.1 hypothetical protein EV154DRAFT_245239 [Mucor mucedo]
MAVSAQQLTSYSATLYNASPTLLPENIASFITAIALATRLSLRCSSLLIEALLESVKHSTSFSFGLSRQALINALSTAKKLHELTAPSSSVITADNMSKDSLDQERNGFLQVLDKYTNLGVYIVHHSFTLVELFTLSGIQFTSQTIKSGLMAAEESVSIIDGIFGSNESSRAIASIVTLVNRELTRDPNFALTKVGKVAILSGLTKAMTAFAVLQNVTHKRTMKNMKTTVLWKGLVVEEDTQKALIQYKEENTSEHDDIIHELEEILAGNTDDNKRLSVSSNKSIDLALDNFGNPYNMYEVTTTTNRITTRTTQIRPIDVYGFDQPKTKQIVEKTNEEEQESFMAAIDPYSQITSCATTPDESSVIPFESDVPMPVKKKGLGFKIMLSSVSKKLSRKKVERQTQYGVMTQDTLEETVDGPITTMTSTSTTLQSSYSQRDEKSLPSVPFSDDPEPDHKSKRRMSWSGMKFNLAKKKSVSNLFQKGVETLAKKRSPPPPMPTSPYIHKSNSINSLASLSRTLKTTTFYTTPSKTLLRSPSVPAKLHQKKETSPLDTEPNPRNFPRKHIINNIAHFIRYASAAYGESFMRILGIGDIPSVLPNSHHPNHHAFAHHTGVAIEDILLSSYTDTTILSSVSNSKLHALVHYVTVDHSAQAIVLTCRGTLGLGDVLTDLTCEYREFTLPTDQLPHAHNPTDAKNHPRQYVAHGGMLEAAQLLAIQKGKVFEAIKKGLEEHPSYGLVLCGHSLGAGVASLLGVLWSEEKVHFLSRHLEDADLDAFTTSSIKRESCPFVTSELSGLPSGRPIHCYTYGSPCVMSLSLSEYCGQGLVTSVVHAFDIVSSLSLGLLRDFKNVAVSLHEDSHITDEIMNRVIGRYHKKLEEEEHDQWFWALIKTMRADMREEKLFPPSTTYLIESVPQLVQHSTEESEGSATSKHKRAHMVQLSRCDDVQARFSEIVFSRTMFMDHSPNMYEKAIKQLNKGFFGGH